MFEDSLVESNGEIHTKKGKTVFVSAAIHTFLIVVVVLIPLIDTNQIEARQLVTFLLALSPPAAPAPPAPEQQQAAPAAVIIRQTLVDPNDMISPTQIPSEIPRVVGTPASTIGVPLGITDQSLVNLMRGVLKPSEPEATPVAVPPPPPTPPAIPTVLRIGGTLIEANELYKPSPVYPQLAKVAGVQGVVLLEAVISKEGSIKDVRVISGHPLLTQAAADAVRTWRYRPTLLNGEPVDVITTVTVSFFLAR
jgi:periplasmic protein TonB